MATKKRDPNAGKKRYITRKRLSSADGSTIWDVGAEIWLTDNAALVHLRKGTIYVPDDTNAPKQPESPVTVHKAVEKPVVDEGVSDGATVNADGNN